MQIIDKYTVPEADLTINATNDNADWASGTTYSTNDLVTHDKKTWKATTGSTGSEPSDTNTDWAAQGYANKWRWSDDIIGTKTTNSNTIELEIANPNTLCNGIAFFGLVADSVQVIVTDTTDGEVYNTTQSLTISEEITDWYTYFFEPYSSIQDTVFVDLPMYFGTGVTIDIIIDNTGDTAEVGEIVLGQLTFLGETIYPITTRIIDFSRKTTDDDGNFIIDEKPFIKRAEYAVSVEAEAMSVIQNKLASIRSTPTVFIGDVSFKNSIVYGYYKDFSIVFDTPPLATCNLSVDGLI